MKILFVNPPLIDVARYSKDLEGLEEVKSIAPPLGIGYLAAVLQKNGYETEIIDAMMHNYVHKWDLEKIINEILKRKADLVCFTATTITIQTVGKITKILKERDKDMKFVLGGPHISVIPENCMKEVPEIDIGVIGEGEYTLLEIVQRLESGKSLDDVKGTIVRKNGKLIKNERRPLIKNIDDLPFPARDLFYDINLYKHTPGLYKRTPHVHMMTSRGCPFNCIFCASNAIFGKSSRLNSTEYVMSEIREIIEKYKAKELIIYDDMFTINHKRVEEICNSIIKEKLDIVWSCQGRVNSVNRHILDIMKKAGCWSISYGIESGDQRVLDIMKKGITVEQVKNAVRLSKASGMYVRGFFMFGSPGDTKETIEKTINLASSLDLDVSQFSITTPFPGTELWDMANEWGTFEYKDWSDFNTMVPLFVANGLDSDYLIKKTAEAFVKCHVKPKYIIKRLLKIRSPDDIRKNLQGLKMVLKMR